MVDREELAEDERRAATYAQIDGMFDLLPRALAVLKKVEWEGDPEGSYEYQDRTVACPSCGVCVDVETGLESNDDDDDEDDDDTVITLDELGHELARKEGWDLVHQPDGSTVIWAAGQRFLDHQAAAEFVQTMADYGSEFHRLALAAVVEAPGPDPKAWQHADDCQLDAVLKKAKELGIEAADADA